MYTLHIESTGKGFGKNAEWQRFDRQEVHGLESMREVYAYLRKHYGTSKRSAMYRERKDGTSYRTGWVIGFRNAEWSHAPVEHWLQQDWIELHTASAPVDLVLAAYRRSNYAPRGGRRT